MRRRLPLVVCLLAALGLLAWRHQSRLIGLAAEWWLSRVAAGEEGGPDAGRRAQVVAGVHRQLLMAPPPPGLVPELFDLVTRLASRVATGEVSLPWAAHVYTAYERDLERDRPDGQPRRSLDEIETEIVRVQEFYSIRKRPDVPGVTVADMLGTGDDVITLDEIEAADRGGTAIDLRTRGAR